MELNELDTPFLDSILPLELRGLRAPKKGDSDFLKGILPSFLRGGYNGEMDKKIKSVDLGDVSWEDLRMLRNHVPFEALMRLLFYKFVFPYMERASSEKMGWMTLEVHEDGSFEIKFTPRFKLEPEDLRYFIGNIDTIMKEDFPPSQEMIDAEKSRLEKPKATIIDVASQIERSVLGL